MLILLRLDARNRLLLIGIGLFGFGAEVLGESTGFPFGTYSYGSALGPSLFDVPIALVSAWIVVTVFAANVLIWANVAKAWWPVAGPIVMVAIDFLLEPVATGPMAAWSWQANGVYYGVPISNFIGWFVVSLPIFAVLSAVKFRDRGGIIVSASVIAFFLVISLINLFWWPLVIATASFAILLLWRHNT
jgi:putative membrane protein